MELHIITPQKKQTFAIVWIDITTPIGSFVIQPGHAPTILTLSENQPIIFRLKNGKQESILVQHGIIEVTRAVVTVLMSTEV